MCRRNHAHNQNQNCRIRTVESWTQSELPKVWQLITKIPKKKVCDVSCVASWAKGQRMAQRWNWSHHNENGLDNGKISFFIFLPPVASSTDCFADAGAVRTSRYVPSQYRILRWYIIKLKMACTGAVQKIELVSTFFPQFLASLWRSVTEWICDGVERQSRREGQTKSPVKLEMQFLKHHKKQYLALHAKLR